MEISHDLLAKVFDIATSALDFGSGFLDDEQVEALREIATMLNIDPLAGTPSNYVCRYSGEHNWHDIRWPASNVITKKERVFQRCLQCGIETEGRSHQRT